MRLNAIGLMVIVLLAVLGIAGAGCLPEEEIETGKIEVRVTDTPNGEDISSDTPTQFEISSIIATVSEIKICKTVLETRTQHAEGAEQGEWISLDITAANPFDLLKLSGLERVLALAEVEAGHYSQIKMTIDRLDATLNDGQKVIIIPSGPFEFTGPFVVFADETTTVVFDFDIDKSVVIEGDKASIKPITGITMSTRYERSE